MTQQGILIIVSGPSGTGKGTICKELMLKSQKLHYSVSSTTRSPRTGEVNGVNYCFTTHDDFKKMIDNNEMLEWAEVYGNYYGTPRRYVEEMLAEGKDVLLEIDTQGAMQIKNKFPQGTFIYIIPPSLDELANRISKRGTDSPEVIKKRLDCVQQELSYVHNYNYIVVNDVVSTAVEKIQAIIMAEKCQVSKNIALIDSIYNLEHAN